MKIGEIFTLLNGDKLIYCYTKDYYAFLYVEKNKIKVYSKKRFHEEYEKRLDEILDSKYDAYEDDEVESVDNNSQIQYLKRKFKRFKFIFDKHGRISISIPVIAALKINNDDDSTRITIADKHKMDLCRQSIGIESSEWWWCKATYIKLNHKILFDYLLTFGGQIIEFLAKSNDFSINISHVCDNSENEGIHVDESGIFLIRGTTNTPLKFINNAETYKFIYLSFDREKIGIANSWFIDNRMLMNNKTMKLLYVKNGLQMIGYMDFSGKKMKSDIIFKFEI